MNGLRQRKTVVSKMSNSQRGRSEGEGMGKEGRRREGKDVRGKKTEGQQNEGNGIGGKGKRRGEYDVKEGEGKEG